MFKDDFIAQMSCRSNVRGTMTAEVDNILALIAHLSLGWLVATIICNAILKVKMLPGDNKMAWVPRPIDGVKFLINSENVSIFKPPKQNWLQKAAATKQNEKGE